MPAPAVTRSAGPNGTHWFSRTPWKGDIGKGIIPNEIEVDCSIEAIEAAVTAFETEGAAMGVPAQKAKAGAALVVRPGVLVGGKTSPAAGGAAIVSRTILKDMGSAAWEQKLLIWPKEGADSVRVNGQISFDGTKGIVWAGMSTFDPNNERRYARDGIEINNCEEFGWGWAESAAPRVNANAGRRIKNVELKEFGWDGKITRDGDWGGLGVSSTGQVDGLIIEGFDMPAVYHYVTVPWTKLPSEAHSDSWQLFGGQNVKGIVFRDGRGFASTEALFQLASYPGILVDNVDAYGSPVNVRVYPYENNEATDGNLKAFSGAAQVTAVNSDLVGSVTKTQFQPGTTGTQISYNWTGASRGLVTPNLALQNLTASDVFARMPRFTAARRTAIFGASTAPVDTTKPTASVLGVPVVSGQDVQLAWSAATDEGTGVVRYIVKRDGTEVTTSAPITGTTWTDSGRPRGTNPTYTVQAVDGAGNIADLSNPRTASIPLSASDTVKPTGAIISPDGTVPISGTAVVQITAADNVGVAGVTLWSGPQKLPGTFALADGALWEGRLDSTKYPDGVYPVEPHIVDTAGNEFVGSTVAITIRNRVVVDEDKDAPSTPVLTIEATGLHTANAAWTLSEDASGAQVKYQFELDGDVVENDITVLARALSGLDSKPRHTARVIAYDPAGNTASSALVPFTTWAFDNNGPVIVLDKPAAGTLAIDPQPFQFKATDIDSGVLSADIYSGDSLLSPAATITGEVWGASIAWAQLQGITSYRVRAVDQAGNVSWSAPVAIALPTVTPPDTTGPVVVVTQPAGGSVVPDFLELLATVSDAPSGVSSAEVRLAGSGQKLADLDPLNAADSTWAARIPRAILLAAVGDGSTQLSFVVRGFDRRGNWTDSAIRTVTVPAPAETFTGTLTLTLPAGGFVDATGQRISDGRYVIAQRVTFPNADRVVTQAATVLIIDEGVWLRGNEAVTEVDLEIPPGASGLLVELEVPGVSPDRALYLLPETIPADRRVSITQLRRSGIAGQSEPLVFLPAAAEAVEAAARAEAAAKRAEAVPALPYSVTFDPSIGAYRITERTN
ncbi:hypothetical protein EDF35_1950 [Rathayibacter sp. PhB151]|uniref:hypothetical protein n=1 Tax=Rathayibacter sp. PhB151 TaxID=2485189 RepID=UPI001062D3ED|nr:hypothetical protein [Rathayibacter sp. PhB151]TDX78736.1 hypothetical protein EDF35_1950 [Rathayibacter sp. PhB151]